MFHQCGLGRTKTWELMNSPILPKSLSFNIITPSCIHYSHLISVLLGAGKLKSTCSCCRHHIPYPLPNLGKLIGTQKFDTIHRKKARTNLHKSPSIHHNRRLCVAGNISSHSPKGFHVQQKRYTSSQASRNVERKRKDITTQPIVQSYMYLSISQKLCTTQHARREKLSIPIEWDGWQELQQLKMITNSFWDIRVAITRRKKIHQLELQLLCIL